MKKTLLFLLGLVMLGSCAQTDSLYGDLKEQDNTSREIRFDNGFGTKRTKAIIEDNTMLQDVKINVYAKVNGTTNIVMPNNPFLIYGDSLAYSTTATKWACERTYFWPKKVSGSQTPRLDFFAYAPNNIGDAVVTASAIEVSFNAQRINADALDLVYDSTFNHTYDSIGNVAKAVAKKGYVDFNMEHKLSWVSFEAKATTQFDSLRINSIAVKVDKSKAKLNIALADGNATLSDTTTNYTYNFTVDTVVFNQTDTSYVRVADFIAIPQMVSDGMTAVINYTAIIGGVKYDRCETEVKLNKGDLYEQGTVPAIWKVKNWLPAYKYTYRINFNWQEILFTAIVTSWDADTNANPGNDYYLIY